MNRRSFFRSLALIGSAVSLSPNIFIPKFEPVKWARARKIETIFVGYNVWIFPSSETTNQMIPFPKQLVDGEFKCSFAYECKDGVWTKKESNGITTVRRDFCQTI